MKTLKSLLSCVVKRRYATASPLFSRAVNKESSETSVAVKEPVPDVMVTFGNPPNHMTFLSHPGNTSVNSSHLYVYGIVCLSIYIGVMAVCKLLEMKYLVTPRACLTQENVDAIREFDSNLADVRINIFCTNRKN